MEPEIRLISSMATRALLAELAADYARQPHGCRIALEAVGGVDAARRVREGEAFDTVVLAAKSIDELIAAGRIVAGSRIDLVRSGVAVAVRAGAPRPDIDTEDALRRAVLAAPTLGYSTGPSGVHLQKVFERWGIAEEIAPRVVQAPPGVPVGTLVADGRIALGFQQLSELMHLGGVDVVGPLPPQVQIVTTFAGGVASASRQADAVRALLEWMAGPAGAAARARHGMEAAAKIVARWGAPSGRRRSTNARLAASRPPSCGSGPGSPCWWSSSAARRRSTPRAGIRGQRAACARDPGSRGVSRRPSARRR